MRISKISDFSEIGRGSSPRPIIDQSYFVNGKIPWVKIADATASSKYVYETKEHVNEYGASFSRKLAPGSLIVAASGTLGFPIFLGVEGCIHDGWLYFRSIDKRVDKQYLYYCLITFTKAFNLVSYGAAIQNINTDILRNMAVPLPPLPIQQKIAAILSAYDDLIENNNRRIAILEKMAEEIYREWFVRMRFSGHETVKFHKGVPKGWQYAPSSSLLKVLSGGTPKTEVPGFWDGDIPFFTPKDVGSGFYVLDTEKHMSEAGLTNCNSPLYKKDTIFITARGTVGKIALSYRDMAMNQSCYALVPKREMETYFYFLALRESIKYIKSISKSGVFDNIIIDTFNVIPLLVMPDELLKGFNDSVRPLFESVGFLMKSKIGLKQSRDILLSRLITGKLSVEDLDIQFPPSMRSPEPAEAREADG